jgi:hypothetical protein
VAGPQSFGVQHPEPAQPADLDGNRRRHHGVGGIADQRDVEPVGVDLPGGRDVGG